MDRKCLAVSLATALLNLPTHQVQAAPPPDPQLPDAYEPVGSGTILPTAPGAPVGCFGITANPRGLALCDGATYNLPDGVITQTVWDVVRVGYGTTATFTGYQAVAERPAGSYFSPITVFSGPATYAPANVTFIDATVYMAPEGLANAVATTQGTLNLRNATIALNPGTTYAPTQTLAALAAFGGGVVNVENSRIDIPTTIAYGLQVMNTDPGGGLPGQNGTLARINANNTVVRLGSGSGSSARTFGGFVAGESELNVTNGTFELGNYSIGIYNIFSATYSSPLLGSRTNLTDTSLTLGDNSVGWWGSGAIAPARLADTRGRLTVGAQSWGLYMIAGSSASLTDTQVRTGSNGYGALLYGGAELTMSGQAAISASGAGSIGIENNASRVYFNPGILTVLGGSQGLVGTNAVFEMRDNSNLTVEGQSEQPAIHLFPTSRFTGTPSSPLTVTSAGGGIAVTGASVVQLPGRVSVTAERAAVSVTDSYSQVVMSGGGTLVGRGVNFEPVVYTYSAGLFDGTGLAISGIGTEYSWGLAAQVGGEARLTASTIKTTGASSHGAVAQGATVILNNVDIAVDGAQSTGIGAFYGGWLSASDTNVRSSGQGAPGLWLNGQVPRVDFTGGQISNVDGPTIYVNGTDGVRVDLANTSVGGSGQWLYVGANLGDDPADVYLTADHSTLSGFAQTQPGSVSTVVMNDSTWSMGGSSVLTSLYQQGGLIDFAPPAANPELPASYMALTVNQYVGNDGLLAMNTWLGSDGSASDRLVIVDGSASGQSRIQVRDTGGGGAMTVANGILLVQAVDATTSDSSFRLAAPVVAGPYEYFLYKGGVAGASTANTANSWFLRSAIDCAARCRLFLPPSR